MKHKRIKVFFAWQHEEEERWLNKMSAGGLQLEGVGFGDYTFTEGHPGEYAYRLEMLEKEPSHPESKEYIEFMKQMGVEHIGSLMKWVYLRKKTAEGEFEIYSDIDSRIKHYGRIRSVLLMLMVVQLPLLVQNLSNPFFQKNLVFMIMQSIYILLDIFIGIGVVNISGKMNRLKEERRLRE